MEMSIIFIAWRKPAMFIPQVRSIQTSKAWTWTLVKTLVLCVTHKIKSFLQETFYFNNMMLFSRIPHS